MASPMNRMKNVGGWEYFICVILAVTIVTVCPGEEGMIYPVDSVSALNANKPDDKLKFYSQVGQGRYTPLPLPKYDDKRIERFETSFEQCAPGRNSGANEWSAFGVIGDRDFNAMGRDLRVRYPAYDLVFRLLDDDKEIKP